jgi:hypothetical protein
MKKSYLPALLLVAIFFSACTGSRKYAEMRSLESTPVSLDAEAAPAESRKVLYSAYLTLAVDQPDSASQYLGRIAERYEGYAQELGTNRAVIRVKSEALEAALEEVALLGKVQSQSVSGQDVTDQYRDYQIRLENAEKSRDRYLELLAKAENVEAALQVERELERLNETIDLLKGRMNRMDHLEAFSTITVQIKERKKPGVLGYVGLGVYHAFKWLFVRN